MSERPIVSMISSLSQVQFFAKSRTPRAIGWEQASRRGQRRRCRGWQIDAIGVDEMQYSKGHKHLTLVYQIDLGVARLLSSAQTCGSPF
jgi:hypothetical protein